MSIPYERTGRTRQKARTREALVVAARLLLGQGIAPTVEQAAAAAEISRTTAYRYFPNQRALLVAAYPELDTDSLLDGDAPADPEARLDVVVRKLGDMIVDGEPAYRAMLRMSLEAEPRREELVLRRGRAIRWIEDALAPLRVELTTEELHRLTLAIRSAVGIEALVWLTDIGGLSRDAARKVMRWSARALLRSALADRAPACNGSAHARD
ncbi:MAG TPA: TetR family transcriptional regulator [Gaiellaceae bacterium]